MTRGHPGETLQGSTGKGPRRRDALKNFAFFRPKISRFRGPALKALTLGLRNLTLGLALEPALGFRPAPEPKETIVGPPEQVYSNFVAKSGPLGLIQTDAAQRRVAREARGFLRKEPCPLENMTARALVVRLPAGGQGGPPNRAGVPTRAIPTLTPRVVGPGVHVGQFL